MVSNMRILRRGVSNLNAGVSRAVASVLLCLLAGVTAAAQDSAAAPPQQKENVAADSVKFLGGGILALALHESGHLVFDEAFAAHPRLEAIHFGPFPFFAVTHQSGLPPR